MASTPSGHGYWLVAGDGGVFTFGDAHFYGSAAGYAPSGVVDVAPSRTGHGYDMLAGNGLVYRFGDATLVHASTTGGRPAAAFTTTSDGKGFWIVERTGAVHVRGTAHYRGSAVVPGSIALSIVRTPAGDGYWVLSMPGASGPPLPPNSGTGRRIVYSNGQQRVWTVEANGIVSNTWAASGKHGLPPFGTYHIQWRRDPDPDGSLTLRHMQAFWQSPNGGWVGFHEIPRDANGNPIEDDTSLGTPLSHGCVRLSASAAATLWGWAGIGTTVVAVP
jgi:hypothetical protein